MIPKKFQVPHRPGVYIFKNKKGEVLYVGKAVDLHSRVSSYFSCSHLPVGKAGGKVNNLVAKIQDLETIIVNSELEALLLEANLIKKYLPPFNIKLTDDKDYLYIKITKDNFPKVLTARKKELLDAEIYFGPFPSANTLKSTLKKLRRIFPWCSGGRPCFYYHLGLCSGPCAGKIDKQEYNKLISRLIKFLNGQKKRVTLDLKKEMNQYAKKLEFEKAQNIKKTIEGINYLTQPSNIQTYLEDPNFLKNQNKLALEDLKQDLNLKKIPERIECYDISNISGKQAVGSLVVSSNGDFEKKWYRRFKIKLDLPAGRQNDVGMLKEVLQRRIRHIEWPKPDLILVDGGRGQAWVAKLEIQNTKFETAIYGLAKKNEWIYPPNGEIIKLSKSSLSLRLLQKIRDEAHRFALSYHQKLRTKSFFSI